MDKKIINAEPPEEFTGIKKGEPKSKAAGMPAIISSVKHIAKEVGLGRGSKVMFSLNQKGGIDCPGCAWPDPDDERSKLGEYCENGAKAIAEEATSKAIGPDFFKENSVSGLSRLSDYELGKKGRLSTPMYLPKGSDHYEEISWAKAFELTARHLNKLSSPDEAIFYTSGRTSNEAAFLYQLFVRAYGTNNLPDCSNMCHESSGKALSQTVGIGKGSVKLEDFYEAEVILIMGQNPGTNHPRMLTALQKAKKNGAKIISVNPLVETGLVAFSDPQRPSGILGGSTLLTDHYLQVKINGDMALLQLITKILIEKDEQEGNVLDHSFIEDKTYGYQEYIAHIKTRNSQELLDICGLTLSEVETVANLLAKNNKIIACWAMGLTQHKNSVDTIKEVVNLLLLKGSIGKPGAGTCPVRGHSNVQGDRTMGIHEAPSSTLLDNIEKVFNFEVPRHHGHDVVHAIKAMHDGVAKVFFAMGGNFISATPDTLYTAKALQQCELTVQVSTKLNRSHLIHGKEALILPCLGRTDIDNTGGNPQFVSVENSMGVVHSTQGKLTPISTHLLSEPAIVCDLAKATIPNSNIKWDKYMQNYDHIRFDIERTIAGFDDYNTRVRNPGGFYLPNCARDNTFKTKTSKANFTVSTAVEIKLQAHEYLMMTVRSHDQFNTTIYGLDDRYRGIYNERRIVMMNAEDMIAAKLKENDVVDLYNFSDGKERVAKKFLVVSYNIPRQCISTYFPEANVLVPINSTADQSNTPTSKSVVVEVRKRN